MAAESFDHPPQFSAEVKNEWSYTSTPHICFQDAYVDNFTSNRLIPIDMSDYKPTHYEIAFWDLCLELFVFCESPGGGGEAIIL